MKTLFDSRLCGRDFNSHLLQTADLTKWLNEKDLNLKSAPTIDEYDFVQVECLLCAIERAARIGITEEQAARIVEADDFLRRDENADSPLWLLGAEAHRKWRLVIEKAVSEGELSLLDFGSRLPVEHKNATTPKVEAVPVTQPAPAAKVEAVIITRQDDYDLNEKLAALFDPVTVEALEKTLPANGKWKNWAERANRNGLKNSAKEGRGMFNLYKAAVWFVSQRIDGWDLARCNRALANNLPARSRDNKHLLTGDID